MNGKNGEISRNLLKKVELRSGHSVKRPTQASTGRSEIADLAGENQEALTGDPEVYDNPEELLEISSSSGAYLRFEDNGSHNFKIGTPDNNNNLNIVDGDETIIMSINGTDNKAIFKGLEYTGGGGMIGSPVTADRVVIDLKAGSDNFSNNVANSGSVITTLGGIKILPLQSNANGSAPNYASPGWGASLFLGEWGWGNYPNGDGPRLSQRTWGQYYPGSGNVYCNSVRQNIVFTALNTQGPTYAAGYQGYANTNMYYNQGDIRFIVVDPRNGSSNMTTVWLPSIEEPMLGQQITVIRTEVPSTYNGYQTAVVVKANSGDVINCPGAYFINDNASGGVALDPFNDLQNNSSIGFPNNYAGNKIVSVTFVASQNGYYNNAILQHCSIVITL